MPDQPGFDVEADKNFRKDAFLFGESRSRVVVSIAADKQAVFGQGLKNNGVNATKLGQVTAHDRPVDGELFGNITAAKKHYDTAQEQILD